MLFLASGCATRVDPTRPMSHDLPLSATDFAEIKEGSEQHKEVLDNHKFLENPQLLAYIENIGRRITSVSERPHLPYRFFVLDEEGVDMFSLGGGYIYLTRGMLEFVDSEAELAAVMAHEIAHVASGAHTPHLDSKMTKKEIFYKAIKVGIGAAAGAAGGLVGGPASNISSNAVDGIRNAAPDIRKQFEKPAELEADRRALGYLAKAGYDPRESAQFLDKLSTIKTADVVRYVYFLSSHPPYEERREAIREELDKLNLKKLTMNRYEERFTTIRFAMLHIDSMKTPATEVKIRAADPPPVPAAAAA